MDDLDQITEPDRAFLLAYDCGCSVKIVHAWVESTSRCDNEAHAFMGVQPDA